MNPVVVIPARLKASRLPDKPLADIAGRPMIVHVWQRAIEAGIGPVVVACAERIVADAVEAAGGRAVLTDPGLPSGSDRVHAALNQIDLAGHYDVVVNLQGDLPTIESALLRAVLDPLAEPAVDIATLVAPLGPGENDDPNVVKALLDLPPGVHIGRAHAFTRAPAPAGSAAFHHIGLYAYRRNALDRFIALPHSANERRERLEQLRALDAGMRIDAACVDTVPLGVDTPADLARARAQLTSAAASGNR